MKYFCELTFPEKRYGGQALVNQFVDLGAKFTRERKHIEMLIAYGEIDSAAIGAAIQVELQFIAQSRLGKGHQSVESLQFARARQTPNSKLKQATVRAALAYKVLLAEAEADCDDLPNAGKLRSPGFNHALSVRPAAFVDEDLDSLEVATYWNSTESRNRFFTVAAQKGQKSLGQRVHFKRFL